MDCRVITHRRHSSQEPPVSWWRNIPMCCMRFTISASYRKEVEHHLQTAQRLGHVRQVTYLLAILTVGDGQSFAQVAWVLRVHAQTALHGAASFVVTGSTGQAPQQAYGRSPMIPQLIYNRFSVLDNVFSIAQLLTNLG